MGPLAPGRNTRCKLEYRARPAPARRDRFSRVAKSGPSDPSGGGCECPPDTLSKYRRGNCTQATDELCLWARVSGIDARPTIVACISWPGDSIPIQPGEPACNPLPAPIGLLASEMVSASYEY